MITGTVSTGYEILIRLQVRGAVGQFHVVEAILDTGFTGSLSLPASDLATLGLPLRTRTEVVLANGTIEECDLYAGTVIWDGHPRPILIQAIDSNPLLGMRLLVGSDLRARVVAGGLVEIEAVP